MYSVEKLKDFTQQVFLKIGCTKEQAILAADVLLSSDLRGVDSHGISRLNGYIRLWENSRVNTNPEIKIERETASTAQLDGDRGLGLVVAPKAMEIAINKAKEVGTGWVSVKNSNHFGIAGYHAMLALKHKMIGIAMTNASPLVSPTYSSERLLGTNPIAVAIPAHKQPPFVADFATTTTANGKLEILQRKNELAPDGWIQKADGSPSNNPKELKLGGSLLPLGGRYETGGHKGYCLGAIVDIFSALLSGANYGPWVPPFVSFLPMLDDQVGDGIGHFLGAMRIDAFRPEEEFLSHMDNWISRFRTSATIPTQEKVLIPGDLELACYNKRKKEGIPISESLEKELGEIAEKFGLKFSVRKEKM